MATTKSLCCTAALLLCLVIVDFHRAQAQCGGFQGSCNTFAIGSDGTFTADCSNSGGSFAPASISLDNYISNSNGNMVDGAGFSASCQNLGWANENAPNVAFYIIGSCAKGDGSFEYTSYQLSYHLANDNGVLSWHSCRRSPTYRDYR